MRSWERFYTGFWEFRSAFSDCRTFYWAVVVAMGMAAGFMGSSGIAGCAQSLGLRSGCYTSMLGFFHSTAINLQVLRELLIKFVMARMDVFRVSGYAVLAIDGINGPKEGRRMPGVRITHQSSGNNSKPEFVMAHNWNVVAVLVRSSLGRVLAMPVFAGIFSGIRTGPRDQKSVFKRSVEAIVDLTVHTGPAVIVGDALYAVRPFVRELLEHSVHVISRVGKTGVAYFPAPPPPEGKRGRKPVYGEKVKLLQLFGDLSRFSIMPSPIPGETCEVHFLSLDLIPRWLGRLVRFVLVDHPSRGRIVVFSTNLQMEPKDIYLVYYARFQIEMTFKSMVHTIGLFQYRFWTNALAKITRSTKDTYIHRMPESAKTKIHEKLRCYHTFAAMACISTCLMQYLSVNHSADIWGGFRGWLRTLRPEIRPSIDVVRKALANSAFEFLLTQNIDERFAKFIHQKVDICRIDERKTVSS